MRMQHKKKSFIFGNIPLIEDLSFEQQVEKVNDKEVIVNACLFETEFILFVRSKNNVKPKNLILLKEASFVIFSLILNNFGNLL